MRRQRSAVTVADMTAQHTDAADGAHGEDDEGASSDSQPQPILEVPEADEAETTRCLAVKNELLPGQIQGGAAGTAKTIWAEEQLEAELKNSRRYREVMMMSQRHEELKSLNLYKRLCQRSKDTADGSRMSDVGIDVFSRRSSDIATTTASSSDIPSATGTATALPSSFQQPAAVGRHKTIASTQQSSESSASSSSSLLSLSPLELSVMTSLLKSSPLCADIVKIPDLAAELTHKMSLCIRVYHDGDCIFAKRAQADKLFMVLSGRVNLVKNRKSSIEFQPPIEGASAGGVKGGGGGSTNALSVPNNNKKKMSGLLDTFALEIRQLGTIGGDDQPLLAPLVRGVSTGAAATSQHYRKARNSFVELRASMCVKRGEEGQLLQALRTAQQQTDVGGHRPSTCGAVRRSILLPVGGPFADSKGRPFSAFPLHGAAAAGTSNGTSQNVGDDDDDSDESGDDTDSTGDKGSDCEGNKDGQNGEGGGDGLDGNNNNDSNLNSAALVASGQAIRGDFIGQLLPQKDPRGQADGPNANGTAGPMDTLKLKLSTSRSTVGSNDGFLGVNASSTHAHGHLYADGGGNNRSGVAASRRVKGGAHDNGKYKLSAVAVGRTVVAHLSVKDFMDLQMKARAYEVRVAQKCLRVCPSFSQWSNLQLHAIALGAIEMFAPTRSTLLARGEPVRHLFVIKRGMVLVSKPTEPCTASSSLSSSSTSSPSASSSALRNTSVASLPATATGNSPTSTLPGPRTKDTKDTKDLTPSAALLKIASAKTAARVMNLKPQHEHLQHRYQLQQQHQQQRKLERKYQQSHHLHLQSNNDKLTDKGGQSQKQQGNGNGPPPHRRMSTAPAAPSSTVFNNSKSTTANRTHHASTTAPHRSTTPGSRTRLMSSTGAMIRWKGTGGGGGGGGNRATTPFLSRRPATTGGLHLWGTTGGGGGGGGMGDTRMGDYDGGDGSDNKVSMSKLDIFWATCAMVDRPDRWLVSDVYKERVPLRWTTPPPEFTGQMQPVTLPASSLYSASVSTSPSTSTVSPSTSTYLQPTLANALDPLRNRKSVIGVEKWDADDNNNTTTSNNNNSNPNSKRKGSDKDNRRRGSSRQHDGQPSARNSRRGSIATPNPKGEVGPVWEPGPGAEELIGEDVPIGVLGCGQVFGEMCILQRTSGSSNNNSNNNNNTANNNSSNNGIRNNSSSSQEIENDVTSAVNIVALTALEVYAIPKEHILNMGAAFNKSFIASLSASVAIYNPPRGKVTHYHQMRKVAEEVKMDVLADVMPPEYMKRRGVACVT